MNHKIVETLDFERETKGSVLYKKVDVHSGTAVYNIYIRKSAFGNESYPSKITVTIAEGSND